MDENGKIRLGIVASGGGTDANAIMAGWRKGEIPNVGEIVLFGTKRGAGCFDKADDNIVKAYLVECASKGQVPVFNKRLKKKCEEKKIDMLFLAGCIWGIDTRRLKASVFNIHPADTLEHGGRNMYGLAVHEHVLARIKDDIYREFADVRDDFYTQINIHRVNHAAGIDRGKVFIKLDVPIPGGIILEIAAGTEIKGLAVELQKYVLQYEHMILPSAVNILAKICLDVNKLKD